MERAKPKKDTPTVKPRGTLVYVTQYALTAGIIRTTTAEDLAEGDRYLVVDWNDGLNGRAVFSVRHLAWSENEAREAAEHMRTARLASLAKSTKAVQTKKIKLIDRTPGQA